jgi:hypothetical protein
MTDFDPALKTGQGAQVPSPRKPDGAAPGDDAGGGFLHHLWEVINPLEHLPVIATLYRAITGEHIGTLEKIAGDALYGGLWGAVSSLADTAFTAVTGNDFGDTVLALLSGSPRQAVQSAGAAQPQETVLASASAKNGVNGDTLRRAQSAYRRSMALPGATPAN